MEGTPRVHKVTLSKQFPGRILHMEIELPMLPFIGMRVYREEFGWLSEQVKEVVCMLDDGSITVVVDNAEQNEPIEEYRGYGWQ